MTKEAGIRFKMDEYYKIRVDDDITLTSEINGVTTEYDVTGGGSKIERKRLYTNPDTTIQMTGDSLFLESEIEGYEYLSFIITDITGSYEVEELCEIEPLKNHGGQFVISMPVTNNLYCRKIYRSSGSVKPSTSVFDLGKTTGDKNYCIIKTVDCLKGVK